MLRYLFILCLGLLTACAGKQEAPPVYGCESMLLSKFDRINNDPASFATYIQEAKPEKAVLVTGNMPDHRGGERVAIGIRGALKELGYTVEDVQKMPEGIDPATLYVNPLCLRTTHNDFEMVFLTVTEFRLGARRVVYDLSGTGRYDPSLAEAVGGVVASVAMPVAFVGQMSVYHGVYSERAAYALKDSYEAFLKGEAQLVPEHGVTTCRK